MAVSKAIRSGELKKSDTCQVCDRDPSAPDELKIFLGIEIGQRGKKLIGHHWRGYDYPLDVWWVCYSCNRKLRVHDGSVSLQQAREIIERPFEWFSRWERKL
jgi:hypothetical protein